MMKLVIIPILFASMAASANAQECRRADAAKASEIARQIAQRGGCQASCKGCGCNGGPGYRNPANNQCVGWRQLNEVCGPPPHRRCEAECVPVVPSCKALKDIADRVLSKH